MSVFHAGKEAMLIFDRLCAELCERAPFPFTIHCAVMIERDGFTTTPTKMTAAIAPYLPDDPKGGK